LYTFHIGEHTDSYLHQNSDYHMDMTQNLSELSSLLFVISSPHTVNLIIENHGLSRL